MLEPDEKNAIRKSGFAYAAVFSMLASIISLLFVGWLLDRWLATSPWLVVTGIILGTVVGFYEFIRIMSKS
jgi:ATP synthase protein I